MTNNAIEIEQLSFTWSGADKPTISIDNWVVEAGQRIFLYGPSGSGKSTLLNLLSGILVPQTGGLKILGESFGQLSGRKRDNFRAANLGVIFQQFNLIPYLSVADNILLAVRFAQKNKKTLDVTESHIQQLLSHLNLSPKIINQNAGALSVGQQQRVAIARALIHKPGLLIADEPTSALDSDSRDDFIQLFLDCAREYQSSVVFVSHDRSLSHHFDQNIDINALNQVIAKADLSHAD